jgi:hypothetical protein
MEFPYKLEPQRNKVMFDKHGIEIKVGNKVKFTLDWGYGPCEVEARIIVKDGIPHVQDDKVKEQCSPLRNFNGSDLEIVKELE